MVASMVLERYLRVLHTDLQAAGREVGRVAKRKTEAE